MAASLEADKPLPQSSLSFTQGFLLGQLSITLLIFAFIKFFIFGEAPPPDVRAASRAALRRQRTLEHQRRTTKQAPHSSSSATTTTNITSAATPTTSLLLHHHHQQSAPPVLDAATILAKTYYNVSGHQPESLDWFNVLVAQAIAQLRADAQHDGAVLGSLTELMNGPGRPEYVSEINVTEISLGDDFPIFSNCRIIPVGDGGGIGSGSGGNSGTKMRGAGAAAAAVVGAEGSLQARMDVDLSDVITLGVETTLVLNYPKPVVALLPVALAVSVVRFSGTLTVSFTPSSTSSPPNNTDSHSSPSLHTPPTSSSSSTPSPTTLAFTFLDDYRLDLSVRSLLGSRSRLQDVPKIAQLVEARLHAWFDERCVEPRFQQIVLPSLWPKKRNTRGGSEEGEGEDGSSNGGKEGGGVVSGGGETVEAGKRVKREGEVDAVSGAERNSKDGGGVGVEGLRRRVGSEAGSVMPGSMNME